MNERELADIAISVKVNAYVPYSNFHVGAAVLTENGKVYTGVNVENISYGATNCAERTAIFKAVTDGERKIKAIAIASDSEDYVPPCGICRQVMSEFSDPDMKVICSRKNGEYKVYRFDEILPYSFKEDLKNNRR